MTPDDLEASPINGLTKAEFDRINKLNRESLNTALESAIGLCKSGRVHISFSVLADPLDDTVMAKKFDEIDAWLSGIDGTTLTYPLATLILRVLMPSVKQLPSLAKFYAQVSAGASQRGDPMRPLLGMKQIFVDELTAQGVEQEPDVLACQTVGKINPLDSD